LSKGSHGGWTTWTRSQGLTSSPRSSRRFESVRSRPGPRFASLEDIRQPTLVVNGIHDEMIPISNSYRLGENLPNAVLLVYQARDTVPSSSFTRPSHGRPRLSLLRTRRLHPTERDREHPELGPLVAHRRHPIRDPSRHCRLHLRRTAQGRFAGRDARRVPRRQQHEDPGRDRRLRLFPARLPIIGLVWIVGTSEVLLSQSRPSAARTPDLVSPPWGRGRRGGLHPSGPSVDEESDHMNGQGAYWVKTKSRSLAGAWQGKHVF
jgi:hypothetical protein